VLNVGVGIVDTVEKQNLQHFFEYSKLIIFGIIPFMLGRNSFIRAPSNSSISELFYKKNRSPNSCETAPFKSPIQGQSEDHCFLRRI
jgi:hypothetical protein